MLPVAILCGGRATRLGELTKDTPKYLVDVCGKPFAYWQLQLLKEQGYTDIVLLTGHLHEQIEAMIGDGSQWGVNVRYQRDPMDGLGTHGAIQWALQLLGPEFFVLYGDSYLSIAMEEFECVFRRSKLDALLTVFNGIDYGLRAFRRYYPRHAQFLNMAEPFQEIGSFDGLADVRRTISQRNGLDCADGRSPGD